MKRFKIFLIFLVCVMIQIQLARKLSFVRIVPIQLLLIAMVCYCIDRDWFGGMLVGISAGLMLDLLSGGRLGVYTLSYGIVGFLIGSFQALVFKEDLLPKLFIVFAATLVLQSLNFQIIKIYQPNMAFIIYLYRSILPGALLNCAAAAPIFVLMQRKRKGFRSWSRGRRRVLRAGRKSY